MGRKAQNGKRNVENAGEGDEEGADIDRFELAIAMDMNQEIPVAPSREIGGRENWDDGPARELSQSPPTSYG